MIRLTSLLRRPHIFNVNFYTLKQRTLTPAPISRFLHFHRNTDHIHQHQYQEHWTADQDLSLQIAVQKYGTNWSKIVKVLPEKSPNQCKQRWKHLLQEWRRETPVDREKKLHGSKNLVGLAMAGNFTLCLCKLGASIYTGSTSLFSESVHSFVDMINQGLLLIGIQRSLKQPNLEHPYGFYKEQYAWAIISAVGILFVGGGVPIFSGIGAIVNADMAHAIDFDQMKVAYGVLGAAFCMEGFTASKAFVQVKKSAEKTGVSIREYLSRGSDPSAVQVLLEDSSSVCGTLIAATTLSLSFYLQNPVIDACGSIAIGGLLSSIAVFLIRRNMRMVLETSMDPEKIELVTRVISSDPIVTAIQDIKSSSIGPEHSRFKAEVSFNGQELTRKYLKQKEVDLSAEMERLKNLEQPEELQAYLTGFGSGVVDQLADEIDRIEDNIKDTVPEVKHVDLEVS